LEGLKTSEREKKTHTDGKKNNTKKEMKGERGGEPEEKVE